MQHTWSPLEEVLDKSQSWHQEPNWRLLSSAGPSHPNLSEWNPHRRTSCLPEHREGVSDREEARQIERRCQIESGQIESGPSLLKTSIRSLIAPLARTLLDASGCKNSLGGHASWVLGVAHSPTQEMFVSCGEPRSCFAYVMMTDDGDLAKARAARAGRPC